MVEVYCAHIVMQDVIFLYRLQKYLLIKTILSGLKN